MISPLKVCLSFLSILIGQVLAAYFATEPLLVLLLFGFFVVLGFYLLFLVRISGRGWLFCLAGVFTICGVFMTISTKENFNVITMFTGAMCLACFIGSLIEISRNE